MPVLRQHLWALAFQLRADPFVRVRLSCQPPVNRDFASRGATETDDLAKTSGGALRGRRRVGFLHRRFTHRSFSRVRCRWTEDLGAHASSNAEMNSRGAGRT
jgi:hypothetical protein